MTEHCRSWFGPLKPPKDLTMSLVNVLEIDTDVFHVAWLFAM